MNLRSRKGFEVAINTIVVMVLGIVIISGGILLVSKLSKSGVDLNEKITAEQRAKIYQYQQDGQLVAIAPSNQKVRVGDTVSFGLGVKNTLPGSGTPPVEKFKVSAPVPASSNLKIQFLDELVIAPNERKEAIIVVTPDTTTPKGVYTVIVTVKNAADTIYDSPRFFTVTVE